LKLQPSVCAPFEKR